MSAPSAADLQTLTTTIAALSDQVSGLLSRIVALEWQPRSGVAAPPMTPASNAKGPKCKGKAPPPPAHRDGGIWYRPPYIPSRTGPPCGNVVL